MSVVLRDVVIGEASVPVDVRIRGGNVVAIGRQDVAQSDVLVAGQGGRLLPGLVDHHLHLSAWARAQRSLPFPADGLTVEDGLRIVRAGPASSGWTTLFGLDHHHALSATMDLLDRLIDHPVLVVHRTGHEAYLNAAGTGGSRRRWRRVRDVGGWWRRALGPASTQAEHALFTRLRDDLLAQGVTAVHDATPYPAAAHGRVQQLGRWLSPVQVRYMAAPLEPISGATHTKILCPLETTATSGGPLAVHAVEPQEIVAALRLVGRRDRIEHAALCPPELVAHVGRSHCAVCANPGFLVERAAALQPLIETGEADFLQPLSELHEAGTELKFGSDAPVGSPGPWGAVQGALHRGPTAFAPFPGRKLHFDDALRAVTTCPELVAAAPSSWVGRSADLTILPSDVSARLPGVRVLATLVDGEVAYLDGSSARDVHAEANNKEMQWLSRY